MPRVQLDRSTAERDVPSPAVQPAAPRIKSPMLCSFFLLELLANNSNTCRELPFCPVACIRAALRIPGYAGPYRGHPSKHCWLRELMPSLVKTLSSWYWTDRARADEPPGADLRVGQGRPGTAARPAPPGRSAPRRVDVVDEAFEEVCAFVLAVVLGVVALADQDGQELGPGAEVGAGGPLPGNGRAGRDPCIPRTP
jgi:hypothetical protein